MCKMINDYNRYLKVKKSSDKTIKTYHTSLKTLVEFKGFDIENLCEDDILNLTKMDLEEYLMSMKGYASTTKMAKFNAILSIVDMLSENEEYEDRADMFKLRLAKVMKKIKKDKDRIQEYLTSEEVEMLMNVVKADKSKNGKRNLFIFSMFLDLGLRLSELCDLKHGHIKLDLKEVWIKGKGSKLRILPLSDELFKMYLDMFGSNISHDKEEYVFISNKGNKISNSRVQEMLKGYLDKCEINKDIHIHSLRRTMLTNLGLQDGVDIHMVQQVAGHSSVHTSIGYMSSSRDIIAKAMKLRNSDK